MDVLSPSHLKLALKNGNCRNVGLLQVQPVAQEIVDLNISVAIDETFDIGTATPRLAILELESWARALMPSLLESSRKVKALSLAGDSTRMWSGGGPYPELRSLNAKNVAMIEMTFMCSLLPALRCLELRFASSGYVCHSLISRSRLI